MKGPLRVLRDVFFRGGESDEIKDMVHSAKLTSALFEISRAMASATGDEKGSLNQIISAVPLIMNVSRSILFLFDEKGEHLLPSVGSGLIYMGLFRRLKISPEAEIFNEIFKAQDPFLLPVSRIKNERMKGILKRLGIEELIIAPVLGEEKVRGYITADTPVDGRNFTSDDMKIMSVMANFAGVALRNSRMFQQLEGKAKKLKAIHEVSRAMVQTNDLDRLLSLIIEQAVDLLKGRFGSVILIDKKDGTLIIRASVGLPGGVEETVKLKSGEGITGWVAREGVSALVSDVREDPRYVMIREEIRSEMAVPLKWGEEVFGVLNLDHVKKGAFKDEDLEMLEIFGHNASLSLRQAILIEKSGGRD